MSAPAVPALYAACALSLIALGLPPLLATRAPLPFAEPLSALGAWASVLSFIALARAALTRRAEEERRESDRAEDRDAGKLFADSGPAPFSATRDLERLDRYGLPAVSVAIAAGLGAWAWRLAGIPLSVPSPVPQGEQMLLAAAFFLAEAFALFLAGRYLVGLSRGEGGEPARAAGLALGLVAPTALASAATAVAAAYGWIVPAVALARALTALIALLALEQLARAVLAAYVPHRRRAPTIESRLAAWVADPATWTNALASSLDYQFGARADPKALGRLARRALLPFVAVQAALLVLLSCFVSLQPHEEGVRERWGRPPPDRSILQGGLHLKWPWPVERILRVPSRRLQRIPVGFETGGDTARRPMSIRWNIPHAGREDLFVTPARSTLETRGTGGADEPVSVNAVSLELQIEYRVTNLYDFVYGHRDAALLMRQLAYREVTRAFAGRDALEWLGSDRIEFSGRIRAALQAEADRYRLGAEIVSAVAQSLHPPVAVAEAFQSVIAALEQREASVLEAQAEAAAIEPAARAEAERLRCEAEADRVRLREQAAADVALFRELRASRGAGASLLFADLRLSAVAETLQRKPYAVVASRNARQIYQFDVKTRLFPELYELAPLAPAEETP